jgi:hypothetical protein
MGRHRVVQPGQWDRKTLAKARGRAEVLLEGVGTGPDHWTRGADAIHLRRRLSDAEIERLDPAWLALPAIDAGTPGEGDS